MPPQSIIDAELKSARTIDCFSEVCNDVKLIALETTEESVIGNVDKLFIQDRIYVKSNNRLFVYDLSGKFLFKINRRGKGRSEYLELDDVAVSSEHIVLSDAQSRKLLFYGLNGEYRFVDKFDFFPEKIAFLNDSVLVIACSGKSEKMIRLWNCRQKKLMASFFDYENTYRYPLIQVLNSHNDEVYYRKPFSNDVYSFLPSLELVKKYFIDFREYNVNKEDIEEQSIFGIRFPIDAKGNVEILRFFETTNLYVVYFKCERKAEDTRFMLFMSKETPNKKYLLDSRSFSDDLTFYDYVATPQILCSYDENCLIGVIYPASWRKSLQERIKEHSQEERYQQIRKYVESLDGFQNPIIALYHVCF